MISLEQPSRHFVCIGSLSLWRGANFDITGATFSSLCACQIALVVVRRDYEHRTRNPLGTLCGSDRSRCGVVLILAVSLSLSEIQVKKESYYIVLRKVLL